MSSILVRMFKKFIIIIINFKITEEDLDLNFYIFLDGK